MAEPKNPDQLPDQPTHVLFVDDEPHILSSLRRLFRRESDWVCHFAESPMAALEILAQHRISVLVSDHRMPVMEGAEFLARVKAKRPNTVRIMVTGQANLEDVQKAVNSGEIFRFVLKPWDDEDLRSVVHAAVEFYNLSEANRYLEQLTAKQNDELKRYNDRLEERVVERTEQLSEALYTAQALYRQLEESMTHLVKVLFSFVEAARPDLGAHSRRVAEMAVEMGRMLEFDEKGMRDLEVAALLHDVGKLGMPTYMIGKSVKDYSNREMEIYFMHPSMGAEFLHSITHFVDVAEIIEAHHERLDGSGFPKGSRDKAVPRSALVIGLADVCDNGLNQPAMDKTFAYNQTYQLVAEASGEQFTSGIAEAALDYMAQQRARNAGADASEIGVRNLAPNMILVDNLYTVGGALLVPAGTKLNGKIIHRIRSINQVDPIAGEIYIRWDSDRSLSAV